MREKLFHRDFTLVVIGQIISLLGNAVLRFVLPLYLLDVTGSRSLFGLCSAAAFVPMVVLTPLGGVVADRLHKQRIMVRRDRRKSSDLARNGRAGAPSVHRHLPAPG